MENVRHEYVANETVKISWRAPNGDADAVDYYKIELNLNENIVHEYKTNNLSLDLTTLEFCTPYDLVFNAYPRDEYKNTKYKLVKYRFTTLTKRKLTCKYSLVFSSYGEIIFWAYSSSWPADVFDRECDQRFSPMAATFCQCTLRSRLQSQVRLRQSVGSRFTK